MLRFYHKPKPTYLVLFQCPFLWPSRWQSGTRYLEYSYADILGKISSTCFSCVGLHLQVLRNYLDRPTAHCDPQGSPNQLDREPSAQAPWVAWSDLSRKEVPWSPRQGALVHQSPPFNPRYLEAQQHPVSQALPMKILGLLMMFSLSCWSASIY